MGISEGKLGSIVTFIPPPLRHRETAKIGLAARPAAYAASCVVPWNSPCASSPCV